MPERRTRSVATRIVWIALMVLSAHVHPASAGSIAWRPSFEAALAEGRRTDRPVWVQFTGAWCPYCRRMEQETFVRPEVVARARDRFIPVVVTSDDREDLVERHGIRAYPTTLVLGPTGETLARLEGFAEAAEFLGFLDGARARLEPALGGSCPVSLVQGRGRIAGQSRLTARFDGREYRFANAEARAAFLADPERFVPRAGGHCVVSRVDRGLDIGGDPRFAIYYRDRLYLCADEAARRQFARDPARYADADLALDGICPHCRAAGRIVPGQPRYVATHQDRRYQFPGPDHLAAFRAAPETFLR